MLAIHPALGPVFLTSKLGFIIENPHHKIPLYKYRNVDFKWQSDLLRFIQLLIMEGLAFDHGLIMIPNDSKVYLFTQQILIDTSTMCCSSRC